MVESAVAQYGGLDYAFNNVGFVGSTAGVVETTEADWHNAVATNLTSVWLCMKYEIPEMLKRQGCAIVNNGSVVGLVGLPKVCRISTCRAFPAVDWERLSAGTTRRRRCCETKRVRRVISTALQPPT